MKQNQTVLWVPLQLILTICAKKKETKSNHFMILMKGTCAQKNILESQISNLTSLTPLAGNFKD